jgi:glycosyltransferase involved in cell wall biosynthesis
MGDIVLLFRKKNPNFFSIEKVFDLIWQDTPNIVKIRQFSLPEYTKGFLQIWKNIKSVWQLKGDVFHVTGDVHYVVVALPVDKTVLTIHDCVFLRTPPGIKRSFLKWLLLDMPVRRAGYITTISEFTKNEILTNTDCLPSKIRVIPNPVNSSITHTARAFHAKQPSLLFIGTTENKNLTRVAAALHKIHCTLTILGKLSAAQITALNQNGISYQCFFDVSESELNDLYKNCDLLLYPSLFEGFGLPILESQQAGRVVVTSNISPLKDVAGGAAILVDPLSIESIKGGILKAIGDPLLRANLIKVGFENLSRYKTATIQQQYLSLYQEVIQNSQYAN